jgi:hypothetical protein
MFIAQTGPINISLVALSTRELAIILLLFGQTTDGINPA